MKILFVCRCKNGGNRIVDAQAESLRNIGVEVKVFYVKGKGLAGYFHAIFHLCVLANNYAPDVIHAHYSLCGIISSFCPGRSLFVSLMGSDVKGHRLMRTLMRLLSRFRWNATIVKSDAMKLSLGDDKAIVVPNGVDMNHFRCMVRSECRSQLNWPSDAKVVLFAADPARPEKNYQLALDASKLSDGIVLKTTVDVNHIEMPKYYNAANLLLLTSLWEGSPNVVKEAMACNLPIVSTDVGDVSWLLGDLDGHFIIEKDPSLVSKSINKAIEFDSPTSGRSRIIELGLDSPTIASRLLDLYKGSLRQSRNT